MSILRLNADPAGLVLNGSPASAHSAIRRAAVGTGPVIILIHGFKYDPDCLTASPHTSIFGGMAHRSGRARKRWLCRLGFGMGNADEGLAIAFGWHARGNLWRAARAAHGAGDCLAQMITLIHRAAPHRPIHVISHSMGSEVVFAALKAVPAGAVGRVIALSGASYASHAAAAMQTPAGQAAELFNVTSRENDLFDFIYERLITPPVPGDGAMGGGIALPNVVNIQLDCPRTLSVLARFGGHIAPARRRMCHWSSYTRPGALRFYAHALRNTDAVPLSVLQQALPKVSAPRWSTMLARPHVTRALPMAQKPAS